VAGVAQMVERHNTRTRETRLAWSPAADEVDQLTDTEALLPHGNLVHRSWDLASTGSVRGVRLLERQVTGLLRSAERSAACVTSMTWRAVRRDEHRPVESDRLDEVMVSACIGP